MYSPPAFRQNDLATLHAHIVRTPLALLISQGEDGPQASHLPLLFKPEQGPNGTLLGHFARANPHWRALAGGTPVLVVFPGPQAYVSPSYYPSKARDHKAVPTWDYVTVHARGRAELIEQPERLRDLLAELTQVHEQGRPQPWSLDQAPAAYLERMLGAIVGFSLPIEQLQGTWKLSQNHATENFNGVRDGLAVSTNPDERAVAQLMAHLG